MYCIKSLRGESRIRTCEGFPTDLQSVLVGRLSISPPKRFVRLYFYTIDKTFCGESRIRTCEGFPTDLQSVLVGRLSISPPKRFVYLGNIFLLMNVWWGEQDSNLRRFPNGFTVRPRWPLEYLP